MSKLLSIRDKTQVCNDCIKHTQDTMPYSYVVVYGGKHPQDVEKCQICSKKKQVLEGFFFKQGVAK